MKMENKNRIGCTTRVIASIVTVAFVFTQSGIGSGTAFAMHGGQRYAHTLRKGQDNDGSSGDAVGRMTAILREPIQQKKTDLVWSSVGKELGTRFAAATGSGIGTPTAVGVEATGKVSVGDAAGMTFGVAAGVGVTPRLSDENITALEGYLVKCIIALIKEADEDPAIFNNATTPELALRMASFLYSTGKEGAIGNMPSRDEAVSILRQLKQPKVEWSTCGVHAAVQTLEQAADLSRTRPAVLIQRLYQALALVAELHAFGMINTKESGPIWNKKSLVLNSAYAIIVADSVLSRLMYEPPELVQPLMAVRMTTDQLSKAVQAGEPVIAWVGRNGDRDHFVRITGYDEQRAGFTYVETDVLLTVMPYGTEHRAAQKDFFSMWSHDDDGTGIVLCR